MSAAPVILDSRGWNTAAGFGDVPTVPQFEEVDQ